MPPRHLAHCCPAAFIVTWLLGAALGDLLTKSRDIGGLALGRTGGILRRSQECPDCVELSTMAGAGTYTELLTCREMARDAKTERRPRHGQTGERTPHHQ